MGVFEKYSANPSGNGKKKHVVPKSGGPIGNGQTNSLARDHAAAANEKKRGNGGEEGETMQPLLGAWVCGRCGCERWISHVTGREFGGRGSPLPKRNPRQT